MAIKEWYISKEKEKKNNKQKENILKISTRNLFKQISFGIISFCFKWLSLLASWNWIISLKHTIGIDVYLYLLAFMSVYHNKLCFFYNTCFILCFCFVLLCLEWINLGMFFFLFLTRMRYPKKSKKVKNKKNKAKAFPINSHNARELVGTLHRQRRFVHNSTIAQQKSHRCQRFCWEVVGLLHRQNHQRQHTSFFLR